MSDETLQEKQLWWRSASITVVGNDVTITMPRLSAEQVLTNDRSRDSFLLVLNTAIMGDDASYKGNRMLANQLFRSSHCE